MQIKKDGHFLALAMGLGNPLSLPTNLIRYKGLRAECPILLLLARFQKGR